MSSRGGVRALQLLFVALASVLLAAYGSGGFEKEPLESKIKLGERVEVMTAFGKGRRRVSSGYEAHHYVTMVSRRIDPNDHPPLARLLYS